LISCPLLTHSPLVYSSIHLLHLSSIFFFYCYSAPRDLHSFPTRRSSDLLFLSRLAVFPVLQGHEEKGVVAGPHQAKQAEADNTGGVPDARAVGQDILHLPRNFVGALQGCRNRELEIDVEVADRKSVV